MATRRTIYGAVNQIAQLLDINPPEDFVKASSLNTIHEVLPNEVPAPGERVKLAYFAIGIGGHAYTQGVDGIALPSTKDHSSKHAGLFKQIPFCLREAGNDLTEEQRQKYALRKVITHQGVQYISYWLKRFSTEGASIKVFERTLTGGRVTTSEEFSPTATDREPTPMDTSHQVVNPLEAVVMRATCPVLVKMDAFEVGEVLNAATVLYGSEAYSHVSEIAVVTGADRTVQSPNPGSGAVQFKEVIAAQIHTHIPAQLALTNRRGGFEQAFDLAGNEALYVRGG